MTPLSALPIAAAALSLPLAWRTPAHRPLAFALVAAQALEAARPALPPELAWGALLSFESRRGEHGEAVALATAYGYSEDNAAVVPILPPVEVPRHGATALLFGQLEASLGRDEVTAEKMRVLRVTEERARRRGIVDGMARAGAGIAEALS